MCISELRTTDSKHVVERAVIKAEEDFDRAASTYA